MPPIQVGARWTARGAAQTMSQQFKLKFSHPLAASLGCLCLFFLFLNAGFVIKTPFLDLGKKPLFGQFSLEVLDRLFYLVVMYDYFHFNPFFS